MTDSALPVVTITPRDNGAYRVAGPVVLVDVEGGRWVLPEGKSVFLCRCGHSRAKPFCDDSHKTAGFESVVRAPQPEG
jgi:CDGSH iron-sulfur domain-containing protein 3